VCSSDLLDQRLDLECRRALRGGIPLSLLMIDVDHFKAYNDQAGHLAGDETLKVVARTLGDSARRAGELVARYGGEEFTVVLPGLGAEAARSRAEEIRMAMEGKRIPHPRSPTSSFVTFSVGVSTMQASAAASDNEGDAAQTLIRHADAALYRAKNEGRNRICFENCPYPSAALHRSPL
jgi:diguanylate cyclase (GGDEF)-like protein